MKSVAGLAVLVFAVMLAFGPGWAHAASTKSAAKQLATCSGGACTGQDPQASGCAADGRTVAAFTESVYPNLNKDAYVELRHSNTCRAKWIRVTAPNSDWGCGGAQSVQIQLRNFNAVGTRLATQTRTYGACEIVTAKWTPMVGRATGSYRTQFCLRLYSAYGGTTAWTCKYNLW